MRSQRVSERAQVKGSGADHVGTLPTASGGIARAAHAVARGAGCRVEGLLAQSGLTLDQIENPDVRIPVRSQIKFLTLAADALGDEFLGIRLAQNIDLRELGLLYYVPSSSGSLGEALRRLARYSTIHNEGAKLTYSGRDAVSMMFEY